MNLEFLLMNGLGPYVWSSFILTLFSFLVLFFIINFQLTKEKNKYYTKLNSLDSNKVKVVEAKKEHKEILANSLI